jgi:hypothetical protein
MRRGMLAILVGAAVLGLPASAMATSSHGKHKPKPPTFKPGIYKAKFGTSQFNITLKAGTCAPVPGQPKSPLKLCVALPVSPSVACTVPVLVENPIGSFVAPVQLPTSGKITEQAPVAPFALAPGAAPSTGQSTFSVTFTKKGTASGSLAENLTLSFGTETAACAASASFTANLA